MRYVTMMSVCIVAHAVFNICYGQNYGWNQSPYVYREPSQRELEAAAAVYDQILAEETLRHEARRQIERAERAKIAWQEGRDRSSRNRGYDWAREERIALYKQKRHRMEGVLLFYGVLAVSFWIICVLVKRKMHRASLAIAVKVEQDVHGQVNNDKRVECPNCKTVLDIPEECVIGQHLVCPYCQEKFTYDCSLCTDGQVDGGRRCIMSCPHCLTEYEVEQTDYGQVVTCSSCNNEFVIPDEENVGLNADEESNNAKMPSAIIVAAVMSFVVSVACVCALICLLCGCVTMIRGIIYKGILAVLLVASSTGLIWGAIMVLRSRQKNWIRIRMPLVLVATCLVLSMFLFDADCWCISFPIPLAMCAFFLLRFVLNDNQMPLSADGARCNDACLWSLKNVMFIALPILALLFFVACRLSVWWCLAWNY